ncbi:C-type mannose receptor 2-like [Mugil cephalus]|uniref:C-type mannose receptor 2-like n=1 Tax=Mugil cephalus TaxID=48193 RepID=UPI001FB7B8CE|nr:C-type mannose receptor 2-like [Mugil cephalus]
MWTQVLVFLLLSGWTSVSAKKPFRFISSLMTWAEAQLHCRTDFIDLATIADSNANSKARAAGGGARVWIGLLHGPWEWSQGQDLSTYTWYTQWAWGEPVQTGECVRISNYGQWSTKDCGAKYYFSCYSAVTQSHVLVRKKLSWSEAQSYCRTNHTDLSSITTSGDNSLITDQLMDAAPTDPSYSFFNFFTVYAWFGLHREIHDWSDNSSASYRHWASQQPNNTAECVMMDSSTAEWFTASCSQRLPFLCQAEPESLWRTSVKIRLSGGSADLNDPAVQQSIKQQLGQKLADGGITGGVKLRWKSPPDRAVFHREDEEVAPPAGPEEKDCRVKTKD